jgi:ATP-binding cassette subfamily F protein 3
MICGAERPDGGRIVQAGGTIVGYLAQHTEEMTDLQETALGNSRLKTAETEIRRLEHLLAQTPHPDPRHRQLLEQYDRAIVRFETAGGFTFEARMAAALAGLGLSGEILERPVSSLSGGERMRTGLARLLVSQPDLLLLDEPTNHLDIAGIEWLEDYLGRYNGTVLFISHDRSFINRIATVVCELRDRSLHVYPGDYNAFQAQKEREQDFARQQVKQLSAELERQKEVVQTMLSHRKMSSYHARERVVIKLADRLAAARRQVASSDKRMNFHFIPEVHSGDPERLILKAEQIGKAFDDVRLFEDVNLELKANQKLFIAGPNGCGKSTLIRILTGSDTDFTGKVRLSETVTYAQMGQFVQFADEHRTLFEELTLHTDLNETDARNLLARFGFRDVEVFKQIHVLSGGERARLYLCCLLEERPDLLFLDEPTNHLDIHSREILEQALADYSGAILAISHDRYFIDRCADAVAGFIGQEIRLFQSFDQFRRAEREYTEQQESRAVANPPAASRKAVNRTEQRRTTARRNQERNRLERLIESMEAEQQTIEANLGPETPPETYNRLADLTVELEAAYEDYFELLTEDET